VMLCSRVKGMGRDQDERGRGRTRVSHDSIDGQ